MSGCVAIYVYCTTPYVACVCVARVSTGSRPIIAYKKTQAPMYVGVDCCRVPELTLPPLSADTFASYTLDPAIRSVVMGLDETFDYKALCIGSAYLNEVQGCHFVATNMDAGDRVGAN